MTADQIRAILDLRIHFQAVIKTIEEVEHYLDTDRVDAPNDDHQLRWYLEGEKASFRERLAKLESRLKIDGNLEDWEQTPEGLALLG